LQLGAVELQLGAVELQWLQEEEGKDAILDMKYAGLLSRQVDDVVRSMMSSTMLVRSKRVCVRAENKAGQQTGLCVKWQALLNVLRAL